MTATPVAHFQNPLAPTMTLCERLYVRRDEGTLTVLLQAVDDWAYVTCAECLERRERVPRTYEALDAVDAILRDARGGAEPSGLHAIDGAITRERLGETQPPGTYLWSLRWSQEQRRQAVRIWGEVLGFFTPRANWAAWQLTMQVDVVDPEGVYLTGATVYGRDAKGNVIGHITLREWAAL